MKPQKAKIQVNSLQQNSKAKASSNQFQRSKKDYGKKKVTNSQNLNQIQSRMDPPSLLATLMSTIGNKQSEAINSFMQRLNDIDKKEQTKLVEKSNDSSQNKTDKSKSHFQTRIINSTINPTKVRTVSQKKQQITYPKPKVKLKLPIQQAKNQQEDIRQQRLRQALNRKHQLMQQLKRIDSQLSSVKKHQKTGIFYGIGTSQGSSKNLTAFNAENSRTNSFTNQFQLNLNSQYRKISSGLNTGNSPIKAKEDITYSVPNHYKAVQMLQKLSNEKIRRQQKLMSDMKRKQDQQFKKMKEIQQQHQFQYQQKQKKRAQRIEAYMKKSMLSPLKNLSEKQSQVFEKTPKKSEQKVQKRKFSRSKVSGKAKFNNPKLNLEEPQQNQFIFNKEDVKMDTSTLIEKEKLQKKKRSAQLNAQQNLQRSQRSEPIDQQRNSDMKSRNKNNQQSIIQPQDKNDKKTQKIDNKSQQAQQVTANDTLPATMILESSKKQQNQDNEAQIKETFGRMKSLADQDVNQELQAQFDENHNKQA